MTPTNSYLKLFDACPIKAGDVVKLLRTWKIDEFGCYCELVSPSVVGRTFDVVEKRGNEQGYYILRDQTNNRSCFIWAPFFALELVSSSSRPEVTSLDYLVFHRKSKLKVGDRVMVMRKAKYQELGWDADWVPVMDELVGKIGKITADFAVNGWEVSIDNMTDDTFLFPTFVLQKIDPSEKQPEIPAQVDTKGLTKKEVGKLYYQMYRKGKPAANVRTRVHNPDNVTLSPDAVKAGYRLLFEDEVKKERVYGSIKIERLEFESGVWYGNCHGNSLTGTYRTKLSIGELAKLK